MPTASAPKEVKKNIIAIKDFKSLEDSYAIDKYGDTIREMVSFQVQNGKFVRAD